MKIGKSVLDSSIDAEADKIGWTVPISRRNKRIVVMSKRGMTVDEISLALDMRRDVVAKELQYLRSVGVLS